MKLSLDRIQRDVDKTNRAGYQGARINKSEPTPNLFPPGGTKIYRTGKKQDGVPQQGIEKVKGNLKLNPRRVNEGEFLGRSVEMRGKRSLDKFRDKEIMFYDPIRDFKENVGQFSRDSGAGLGGKFTTKASGKYEDQLGKITVLDPKPKKGLQTGGQVEYAPIKNRKLKVDTGKITQHIL